MTKTKRNETVVRLSDLMKACGSSDHWEIWRLFEKEAISKQLQKMVMGKGKKNTKWQAEYIEIIEASIKSHDEKIVNYEKDEEKAAKELEEALKKFQEAEATLKKIRRSKSIVVAANQKQKRVLVKEKRKLEKMKLFVLVHPTATSYALDKKVDSIIVCTELDVKRMKEDYVRAESFPDKIEDTSTYGGLVEKDLPYDISSKFASVKEYDSAIEYVKMVVKYWAEDKPFELLYNDEGIKYILDSLKLF